MNLDEAPIRSFDLLINLLFLVLIYTTMS